LSGNRFGFSLCTLLLGFVCGIVAKATDSVSIIGDIGTNLGVWVFVATMVAYFSKTRLLAAMNTFLFFIALLAAYYLYAQIAFGFFSHAYFLGWLIVAMVSPIGGLVVWFSRGEGWLAVLCASLPIALLIAEGYPAYYTVQIPLIFDLCCAVILLLVLQKTWRNRGMTFVFSCALAFLIDRFYVLSYLPF
jgi:hypothetical protein